MLSLLFIASCKKDLYEQEIENKELQKNRIALLSGNKAELKKINFLQFKTMVNQNALGTLKNELFLEKNDLQQQKISAIEPSAIILSKYEVDKSSVSVLKAEGHTSYIFTIKQVYPHAITFRNLTIDESTTGTSAYITTYTPTKNWLKKRVLNRSIKFEGKTDITPLDLKDTNLLQLSANNVLSTTGKISALKPNKKVATTQYSCTTVTIYDIVAYSCKAGTHMPWDSGCVFTGSDAAGYELVAGTPQTSCIEIEVPSGNGGNTTPIGPPNYNPCDKEDGPKTPEDSGNEPPISTIDETPCDSNAVDEENPKDKYQLTIYADSINLKKLFNCFKSIPNTNATYSVKLCAALPNSNNINALTKSLKPGHTFITMTKSGGGSTISQSFGFYPESANKAALQISVKSQIVNDGALNHEYHASIEMNNLTELDFNTMMNLAISLRPILYSMDTFNCTDYALSIFNSIRDSSNSISVPDWIGGQFPFDQVNYGTTPNGLYKKINQMKTSGDTNANTTYGKAPKSIICN